MERSKTLPLPSGSRLGPYEIVSLLGAGGMGEVYRANDTRLDRIVAIKILPDALASDPERRSRFEREARAIASLSHPHVCALHDVGSAPSAGSRPPVEYLVMEYLDGDTLASRLARGPLPLPEVLRFGAEIAAALDAAHRQRIIHRDLKPANVMLTRSGVKLLDFGLAKAIAPSAPEAPALSTMTNGMTLPGTILGTLAYMSPEQVEGREADGRSDIFALGAVLYEMATGRRPFSGDSPAGMASAILSAEPPAIAASPSLDRIVRGCLRKDPDRRWQSAQDVALQLGDVESGDRHQATAGRARSSVLPWIVAGAAAAVALASTVVAWRLQALNAIPPAVVQALPLKFTIPIGRGDDAYLALSVERTAFSLSPDGRTVAMAAGNGEGLPAVWLRPLSSDVATVLAGTEGATSVFWSPDSRSVGFFALGKLKRIDLPAGVPVTLCEVRRGVGLTGTWGDGQIVFASVQGDQIYSVPASGGQAVTLLKTNPAVGEDRIPWPSFLPDGRRFLYLSSHGADKGAVMLYSPDGKTREVLPLRTNAAYVEPGFLIYGQDGTVLARRFDLASGTVSGEPMALAEGVTRFGATGLTQFSVSRAGGIVFHSGTSLGRVIRVDRQGRVVAEVRGPSPFQETRLSRDGRELFADRVDPATSRMDIWRIDLERGGESRITSEIAAGLNPVFAPDGAMIFSAAREGPPVLYRRPLNGPEEPLLPAPRGMQVDSDLSSDGRWLIYSQRTGLGNFDLMAVSMADRSVTPFHQSSADEGDARFSPDGRFVSFTSDLAGRRDVYVAPFPGPGPARIVSTTAGALARWSVDGRELFYLGIDGTVYASAIASAGSLQIGKPQVLFTRSGRSRFISYDPTAGGQFIALEPVASAQQQPLRVILNWPSAVGPR